MTKRATREHSNWLAAKQGENKNHRYLVSHSTDVVMGSFSFRGCFTASKHTQSTYRNLQMVQRRSRRCQRWSTRCRCPHLRSHWTRQAAAETLAAQALLGGFWRLLWEQEEAVETDSSQAAIRHHHHVLRAHAFGSLCPWCPGSSSEVWGLQHRMLCSCTRHHALRIVLHEDLYLPFSSQLYLQNHCIFQRPGAHRHRSALSRRKHRSDQPQY